MNAHDRQTPFAPTPLEELLAVVVRHPRSALAKLSDLLQGACACSKPGRLCQLAPEDHPPTRLPGPSPNVS